MSIDSFIIGTFEPTNDELPPLGGHKCKRFKSRESSEFFRLLYTIAKIVFIAARVIALLDFISSVQ